MRWRSFASSAKPVRHVANELGIYDSPLGNRVRQRMGSSGVSVSGGRGRAGACRRNTQRGHAHDRAHHPHGEPFGPLNVDKAITTSLVRLPHPEGQQLVLRPHAPSAAERSPAPVPGAVPAHQWKAPSAHLSLSHPDVPSCPTSRHRSPIRWRHGGPVCLAADDLHRFTFDLIR